MIPLPISHQQEHDFAQIISDQAVFGWEFDRDKAESLYHTLDNRMQEIYEEVRPHLTLEIKKPLKAPFLELRKKDGEFTKRLLDYWGHNEVHNVVGIHQPIEWVEPDIGSRDKLKKQLEKHGWRHVNRTKPSKTHPNGQPKLDEESLEGLDLGETGNLLIEYFKAKQRRSTLLNDKGGWLRKCWEYQPGRWKIPAEANSLGTNTHRCTHQIVANVPAAEPSVYYGEEFRSLYIAPPGWELLGMDAEQLEFRIALSYMGATKMITLVESGEDFHTMIWKDIDRYMDSRKTTKNIVYGSIYGASDAKLGEMADRVPPGMTKARVGKAMKMALEQYMPGLDRFANTVKERSKRGYIYGIDGFPVYMRKNDNGSVQTHKAINTLYQHAGSMVVKRATVYFHKRISQCSTLASGYHQVAHMHDELQGIVREGMGDTYGKIFQDCLVKAGKSYGLKCSMAADYKIGPSWAETH